MIFVARSRTLLCLVSALMWVAVGFGPSTGLAQTDPLSIAADGRVLPVLKSGWYLYEPYEFIETEGAGNLTGIDIRFEQELARRLGYFIEFDYIAWADQIAGIRDGSVDMAAATPTAERAEFAYFSTPYRTESIVLLVTPERQKSLAGLSTEEILDRFKSEGLRLGIVDGFVYGSDALNDYVAENRGTDLIAPAENSILNFRRLLGGKIDGLLEDRLAAIDITWENDAFGEIAEIPLNAHSDIAMMFSKANFSPALIEDVDKVIAEMEKEGLVEDINKRFLVPLFFSQTTGSTWYWLVDIIGTVAFAISGTILGWRIGANIAGFFILSALPAVGGGMVRDILLSRPIASLDSAQNVLIITAISVIGYAAYRIHDRVKAKATISPTFACLFNALDAAGLGSFTVTGIAVTISDPHQHSIFWAPFIGVLTAAGGGIARDTLVQRSSSVLFDDLYTQISLFWGIILTGYIALTPARIEPGQYGYAMWATVLVIIVTRVTWLQRKGKLLSL